MCQRVLCILRYSVYSGRLLLLVLFRRQSLSLANDDDLQHRFVVLLSSLFQCQYLPFATWIVLLHWQFVLITIDQLADRHPTIAFHFIATSFPHTTTQAFVCSGRPNLNLIHFFHHHHCQCMCVCLLPCNPTDSTFVSVVIRTFNYIPCADTTRYCQCVCLLLLSTHPRRVCVCFSRNAYHHHHQHQQQQQQTIIDQAIFLLTD